MSSKIKPLALNITIIIAALSVFAGLTVTTDPFNMFRYIGKNNPAAPLDENSVRIPILMYHHFDEDGPTGTVIPADIFENQLKTLSEEGYTAISFQELCDYVYGGASLPEHPFIITIDDGYMSFYETAFPILRRYDMKATVFIIGVSHGKSLYKDTQYPIIKRFGDAEALEMTRSGLISIQSHSYDMHQHEPYESGPYRKGVLQRDGESDDEYIEAFKADFGLAAAQIEAITGARPFVYSYPFGFRNYMTDALLRDMGVKVTLTIAAGFNTVTKDKPESLLGMNRFNVPGDMTPGELLVMIGG